MERLRQWRSLGLIGAEDGEEFSGDDVERARLVQLFLRRGIGLEAIERAASDGMFDSYMVRLFPAGVGPTYSLAEAAEMVDMDLDLLRKLWSGIAGETEPLREADIETFRQFKTFSSIGFPVEALLQATRVYADAFARIAEMETRLFHFYVHEQLKASGLAGEELISAGDAAGNQALALLERVLLYFHRRGWERASKEDLVLHMSEEAGLTEKAEVPGQMRAAITFVDLSSFTPLAEAMGDVKAAEVLERFSTLVRAAAGRWDGRVVKQIGDAFMLVFSEPRSAVACVLEIEARTEGEPQFPAARSGVHWGSVLYREGDYVGSNVNIAARVAAEAGRHQVLVTSAVRKEAKGLTEVEFVRLGKRRLKGLADDLELFEARPVGAEEREKAVDPVCGMELGPGEAAATLTLEGEERAFCSDECLRRFVAAPEKYSV